MSEFLVIFVILTKQMTFVITPYELDYCPSYEKAQEAMTYFYKDYDVGYWSYQCFERPKSI